MIALVQSDIDEKDPYLQNEHNESVFSTGSLRGGQALNAERHLSKKELFSCLGEEDILKSLWV